MTNGVCLWSSHHTEHFLIQRSKGRMPLKGYKLTAWALVIAAEVLRSKVNGLKIMGENKIHCTICIEMTYNCATILRLFVPT